MPVIPHECPAEEVKGSATNGRGNRDTLSRDARVHSGCPIWHATSYGTGGQPDSAVNDPIRLASLWAA